MLKGEKKKPRKIQKEEKRKKETRNRYQMPFTQWTYSIVMYKMRLY